MQRARLGLCQATWHAIYDKTVVQALRFHSAAYVHGHQVGGTNPSLASALDSLLANPAMLDTLRQHGHKRFEEAFTWPDVLAQYELVR